MSQSPDNIFEENLNVLPHFDGNEPRGWILEARKHFEFKGIVDAE